MKKKSRFKSWLARKLRKWLNKLEPGYNTVNVTYTTVPCVTIDASFYAPKYPPLPTDRINEILAKKLGEEIINYANIDYCEHFDMSECDHHIIYRATIRVAADKRG